MSALKHLHRDKHTYRNTQALYRYSKLLSALDLVDLSAVPQAVCMYVCMYVLHNFEHD
jgi:hypothetical protein